MDENEEKLKPENENENVKKGLYSYSEYEDSLNIYNTPDNNNNFRYQYSIDSVDNNDIVNVSKSDKTFTLCIIAACLNFAFVILFFIFNFKNALGGVSYFARRLLFSYNSLRFLLIFLILFVLSIAGFVFLFLYRSSRISGIFGIIVCGMVCFLCLFLQFLMVVVQLVLYIIAVILFFNNRRLDNFFRT